MPPASSVSRVCHRTLTLHPAPMARVDPTRHTRAAALLLLAVSMVLVCLGSGEPADTSRTPYAMCRQHLEAASRHDAASQDIQHMNAIAADSSSLVEGQQQGALQARRGAAAQGHQEPQPSHEASTVQAAGQKAMNYRVLLQRSSNPHQSQGNTPSSSAQSRASRPRRGSARSPRPPPASSQPAKPDPIQPRLSIHTISNMASDNLYKILYLMALNEFMNRGPVLGDDSYHGIAGIHGATAKYNGQAPGGSGFCVHEHTLFGPWHRPYCMLFEQHLLSACNTVAARFTDQKRKQQAKLTCGKLRAPFWDATIADSPSLLVDQSVRVYDSSGSKMVTISNPLQSYCFRAFAQTSAGTKSPGECMIRISSWLSTSQHMAGTWAGTLSAFLASRSWSCTNLGDGRGCPGNLEMFHNNVHNTVGGDMATLPLAGWDPLFWLHHINVDRMLFLFQTSADDWQSSISDFSPFPASVSCGENIGKCGYSYGDSGRSQVAEAFSDFMTSGAASKRRLMQEAPLTTGGDPHSPQARAYLSRYLQDLNGGYNGYRWRLVVDNFNPNALKNRTFGLHVLISDQLEGQLPMMDGGKVDLTDVRLLPNYCGSYSGFNTYMPEMAIDRNMTIAIYLNSCMEMMGINPDISPLNPEDPTQGPSHKPLTRDQLRLVCVDSDNLDCTATIGGTYRVSLGWDIMTDKYVSEAQAYTPGGDVGVAASSTDAAGPDPVGVPGPDGKEQFMYVKSEEF